jgi:2-polyprenyl-3-methyl-5-hydroxy-6-metoxy-1,4-benzoquinol methylase
MYSLMGSETKEKVLKYLVANTYKTAKEISTNAGVGYKHTFKILKEFLNEEIVLEKDKKYYLKSEFIAYIKRISDSLVQNYSKELFFKNKFDIYNTLSASYSEEKIIGKIDKIIDAWIMKKLDDWYSKYYDPENKEYEEVRKIILSKFDKNVSILEIGTGTGRLTFKFAKDFKHVTAIDKEQSHIDYCKKVSKSKNIEFIHSTAKEFKSNKKFDVIIFSWMGLHYQEDYKEIIHNLEPFMNKKAMIIVLDAYFETEYIKILQLIRKRNMEEIKIKKEEMNDFLIKRFGNIDQKVLFTRYVFPSIEELINNFKIELTLEESHIWTKEDEEKIKKYIESKKNFLTIQEGLWLTIVNKSSTK